MSGWTKIGCGKVELEHFSTSSSVKMTIHSETEITQGNMSPVDIVMWLDYQEFDDMVEAVRKLGDVL